MSFSQWSNKTEGIDIVSLPGVYGCRVHLYRTLDRKLRKIIKGNRKAQAEFYDEFSPMVMGICLRYHHDSDEASDVFQEVFIKLYQNIQQVRDQKALPGWVRKVTVNTALDHLKTLRYPEAGERESHELSDHFYTELLDRLSIEMILEMIDRLPEGYRVIFNLYVVDGYSHREIGERLQISESTSRSQLTHARKLLKRQLNDLGITKYERVI